MEKLIFAIIILAFLLQSGWVAALYRRVKKLRSDEEKRAADEMQSAYCNIPAEPGESAENILKGIENNEFKMYLQFIVDTKTKRIVSAEALSRWESPQKGTIAPGHYIGSMEASGLISRHDFYIFELACAQLAKWHETEYHDISISCNFTRITLSEEDCIDRLKEIAQKYNFDRTKLAIEISEDTIEPDREVAKCNVKLCKELGFKIYLDDLGSGYTALANLCEYPIDVVKIDRDILLKANTKRGKELLSGIVALAHSLNMSVICEGVETEEQNELMAHADCDYIQGWYYAKAMPTDGCEDFVKLHAQKYALA